MFPYTQWLGSAIPEPVFQISVCHILFKVVSAAILLPLTNQVVRLTYRIIPKQKHEDALRLEYIDVNLIGNSLVTMLQIRSEVERMAGLVRANLVMAAEGMLGNDLSQSQKIRENEQVIDYLAGAISDYLVSINVMELSETESKYITRVYQVLNDLERIGDYAEILVGLTEKCVDQSLVYSDQAREELSEIYQNDMRLYDACARAGQDRTATETVPLHFQADQTIASQSYGPHARQRVFGDTGTCVCGGSQQLSARGRPFHQCRAVLCSRTVRWKKQDFLRTVSVPKPFFCAPEKKKYKIPEKS